MNKRLLPLFLAIPLALAACGGADDFESENHRYEAFKEYLCNAEKNSDTSALTAAISVNSDPDAPEEDKLIAMDIWLHENGSTDVDTVPLTVDPNGAGECSGWVWDRRLEDSLNSSAFTEFTYEKAQEAGVVE